MKHDKRMTPFDGLILLIRNRRFRYDERHSINSRRSFREYLLCTQEMHVNDASYQIMRDISGAGYIRFLSTELEFGMWTVRFNFEPEHLELAQSVMEL